MENLNKEQSDEKKYNEMMKPITYTSEYDKKYKYRHEDLIWRSKYRAMKGRLKSLKRLHLLYEHEESGKQEKVFPNSDKTVNETKYTIPRDLQNRLVEDVGLYSVFSDDTSIKGPSIKLARDTKRLFRDHLHHTELKTTQAYGGFDVALSQSHYGKFERKIPEIRTTTDGVLRDHSKDRVKMWNINLRNDDRFTHYNQGRSQSSVKKRRAIQFKSDKGTQSTLKIDSEVQTVQPVTRNDSLDLTEARERSKEFEDAEESKNAPKLVLKAGLEKVHVSEIDFLDGFDRLGEHDCRKMLNEIYFKPDEDIISSIYVLKSDIPSVQLMNVVTVRIPVKIRFDSEKLLFSVRIKIGLVWRRLEANFEAIAGNSMFEGYIVFRTEHRGNFFATCDFIQFTYKVDKRGYKFKNALIPDIQVAMKGGAVEEPEDVTFQVRLLDRQRYSKYEDLSPRLVYPVIYVTDGLWIRRNKSLYSRMVAPLLISISNDTSYGTGNEVYLIREKQGHVNIIGERSNIDQKFIVLLDNKHTTFWYVVTKEINKYKSYEHLLERGFSVATAKTCVCKILTFHENRKEEFLIWVCIVEHPDVDNTIGKFLGLNGVSGSRRLEMAGNGGASRNIDFAARSFDISIELDVNFKQKYYKELPTLTFKVGHTCRVQFKAICRIKPLLCDDIEKYGVIRYIIGSETIHEVHIDTAGPIPDFEEMSRPVVPEYSKEAIEKLLSAESLHSIAYCLSEDEGFDLASRLGISALTVSKILIMYGSVESKNFRLFLLWKKSIKGDVSDIKDFINAFYDIERGDIALAITDALEKCQHFKK